MKRVVEFLVSHGSPLFQENVERQTPCDLAMKANFHDIALFLESRMVFVRTHVPFFPIHFPTVWRSKVLIIILYRLMHLMTPTQQMYC